MYSLYVLKSLLTNSPRPQSVDKINLFVTGTIRFYSVSPSDDLHLAPTPLQTIILGHWVLTGLGNLIAR